MITSFMKQRLMGIIKELTDIQNNNTTGDPHSVQMKKVGIKNAEVLIELVYTLERLDSSNKELAKQNIKLQKIVLFLTVVTVAIAVVNLFPR